MQKSRDINIKKIANWIMETREKLKKGQIINTRALERKCMLNLGCTQKKAKEYIAVVDAAIYQEK